MKKLRQKSFIVSKLLLLISSFIFYVGQAQAHHSFAMFDSVNQIKMTGRVTSFEWTNPHVYIELEVDDGSEEASTWTIECASIGILSRVGWKFNMMKTGDEITVIVGPLHSGKTGGLLKQVTLADGTKMGNGGPAGLPNIE